MKITLKLTLLAPVLALLAACGGGSKDSSSTTTTPTLLSIAVTPATPTVAVGLTQQMTATGTYSDGKTAAITTGLTWSVKGTNISVLSATGLVTGKAIGTDTVTATVGSVSGATAVNVRGQWDAISAGGNHTVARRADGALYAWGWNRQGQLGDGSNNDRTTPVIVSGGVTTWKQVAQGELHTLALRTDGTLWAWGYNQNGQLGDGTTADKTTPVQVGTAKDWVYIAAGKSHSMAINKAGVMYGWGRNFNGQLGDDSKTDRLVPTRVATTTTTGTPAVTVTWTAVAAGATHTLARAMDGSLYVWGGNTKSQLGNGGTTDVQKPAKVGTSTWASVAAGGTHSLGIRADGTLWAWGDNSSGQLGVPTSNAAVTATAPTQVGTATNWSVIASGLAHSLAVRTDGTLYGWGANSNGQVGNGSTVNVGTPTQIGTAITWVTVEAGLQHSAALQKDNTVWLWGRNTEGQLGNGTQTDVTAPAALP
jgi:alpha-tubulin suppressor-like RCC1 family protein